ncbi:hypothetical protein ACFVV7_36790 [Streptomyces globisporus]|uniref:hypothetical protein n=1 Tax=Streptomyces globisporus TaxID=1908 RepID=UPI0036DC9AF9
MSYTAGDRVESCTGDPDLPDGTLGTVAVVYGDYGDGIDVDFDDGRPRNVLACGLDPVL